ncbi:MAG: ABC transporter ATP-binding protein [Candidatus Promineifilaceae bacterium]|nr:ABC transporter ATP-binding protein [Anaerolineaceae bacterium]
MIQINEVSKVYDNHKKAIDNLTLSIDKGKFGLVGPNGAGKTTLMRMLATLIKPTSGQITIFDRRIDEKDEIRQMLGYLPQHVGFHENLTVEQELDFFATMKHIVAKKDRQRQLDVVLEYVNLNEVRKERIKTLSGGMKRRLGIAITMLNNPRLLIIDEPTAGLDPEERIRFRNLLIRLGEDQIVLLSTHIIEDISKVCNLLAIIDKGQLAFHGTTIELLSQAKEATWAIPSNEVSSLLSNDFVASRIVEDEVKSIVLSDSKPTPNAQLITPHMEDAYLWVLHKGGKACGEEGKKNL